MILVLAHHYPLAVPDRMDVSENWDTKEDVPYSTAYGHAAVRFVT